MPWGRLKMKTAQRFIARLDRSETNRPNGEQREADRHEIDGTGRHSRPDPSVLTEHSALVASRSVEP